MFLLIVNNKIYIGFWSEEEGLAESHYDFVIKSFFDNWVLQTHSWNMLKVCKNAKKLKNS